MKTVAPRAGKVRPASFTMRHWLVISCLFSLSLLTVRVVASGRLPYAFLAWNLVLASVPYFISNWLGRHQEILRSRIRLIPLIAAWLIFMPNSFYILTDLFHLRSTGNVQPWFDLTLILSFAWNGILLGILSIQKMGRLLKATKGRFISAFVVCVVMWLNAFGVYIGRFLRFNSWDIFINPFSLIREIGELVLDPYEYRYVWATSICFALFMVIIYYTMKNVNEKPDNDQQ